MAQAPRAHFDPRRSEDLFLLSRGEASRGSLPPPDVGRPELPSCVSSCAPVARGDRSGVGGWGRGRWGGGGQNLKT